MQTGCTGPRIICPSSPVVVTVVGSPIGSSPVGGASLLHAASSNAAAARRLADFNGSSCCCRWALEPPSRSTNQDANRRRCQRRRSGRQNAALLFPRGDEFLERLVDGRIQRRGLELRQRLLPDPVGAAGGVESAGFPPGLEVP